MNVELDEEKIKVLVEEAGLKAVQTIVREAFADNGYGTRNKHREEIWEIVNNIVEELLRSSEFRARVSALCEKKFYERAEEKINNAVARTSVEKLKERVKQ